MNILIVTLYKENYGAFLQAYGLSSYLRSLGHNIYYKQYEFVEHTKIQKSISEVLKDCQMVLDDSAIDLIICGSDEIWNLDNPICLSRKDFWGYGFKRKIPIISYAPSASGTGLRKTIFWAWRLNRFLAVSVRDIRSKEIIQPFVIKRVFEVVDPTFLCDWEKVLIEPKAYNYIFVYSYGLSENDKKRILNYASNNDKQIICCGGVEIEGATIFEGSPFEWLGLIKNADIVFTSTFHGTVFSTIFKKNFMILGKSQKIRLFIQQYAASMNFETVYVPANLNSTELELDICNSKKYLLTVIEKILSRDAVWKK